MTTRPFRFLLLFALMLAPVVRAQGGSLTTSETSAIQSVVSAFYHAVKGGTNYRQMDVHLVSEELHALFQLAQAVERRSAREIKASDHPTDRPLGLEGAVFTPYYEGYNKVLAIGSIRKAGSGYLVEVKLLNDAEQPRLAWTDTAVVIREDGHWKVDDVLLQQDGAADDDSIKAMLHRFAGHQGIGKKPCQCQ
jgi:hypothetical protein